MSANDWSPSPEENATADLALPAQDGTSGRVLPGLIRALMAGVRRLADDRGGALTTEGTANAYTVTTGAGVRRLRPGITLLIRVDRTNTAPATLNVDGTGPLPWCGQVGATFAAGQLGRGRFLQVIWDHDAQTWVSDIFAGLTLSLFDSLIRSWHLSLPDHPDGIGPNAAWRDGNVVRWTSATNPVFEFDSPEGRRTTLRLIKQALPTSPDGLLPGEPWLNDETTISFVPTPDGT